MECALPGCVLTQGLKVCSRCKSVKYCSVQHQKDDWPSHKTVCRPPKQLSSPTMSSQSSMNSSSSSSSTSTPKLSHSFSSERVPPKLSEVLQFLSVHFLPLV